MPEDENIYRWIEIKGHTDLSKAEFLKAIDFCISNSYFQFRDSFYSQIDGCSIGAPLSATSTVIDGRSRKDHDKKLRK